MPLPQRGQEKTCDENISIRHLYSFVSLADICKCTGASQKIEYCEKVEYLMSVISEIVYIVYILDSLHVN